VRSLLRIFGRDKASPPAGPLPAVATIPRAHLDVASAAEFVPSTGLIVIEAWVRAEAAGDAVLRVFAPGSTRPAIEKPVALTPERQALWVALHGHLLPNGVATVRVDLADAAGVILAERDMTLRIRNEGPVAELTRESLKRTGTPLVVAETDSTLYDYADESLAAWHDRSPEAVEAHLATLAASGAATDDEIAALRHFASEGYLVLPGLIGAEQLAELNAAMDDAVEQKVEGYEWGASQRLHNLHLTYPAIRELWQDSRILRILGLIFDAPAKPYQSLTYVFGSEQLYHQDTIVLTPFPAGRMCGVWTALEDIQPESGELMIYPKSHKLPRTYMKDLGGVSKVRDDWTEFGEAVAPLWGEFLKDRFEQEIYQPKAGTVLIWHENLMHAGRVRRDKSRSRRSIVGHYFADGCVAYHDANGMAAALDKVI
jgi:ectoine hydroxylase-related dioxygenase (phytanoyl-CoA dioxygenase family)